MFLTLPTVLTWARIVAIPLIVVISLVYSASRYESPPRILRRAGRISVTIAGFMLSRIAERERSADDVRVPVVGAQNAPALVDWLAQQAGVNGSKPLGGRDLIAAFVAGNEVMIRIGRATGHTNEARGFHAIRFTDGAQNEERTPDVRYRWERVPGPDRR